MRNANGLAGDPPVPAGHWPGGRREALEKGGSRSLTVRRCRSVRRLVERNGRDARSESGANNFSSGTSFRPGAGRHRRVAWSHDIVDTFEADFLMDPAVKKKTKGAKTVVGPLRLARKERLLGKGSLSVAAAKRLGVHDLPSKQNFAKFQRCRETVPVACATPSVMKYAGPEARSRLSV